MITGSLRLIMASCGLIETKTNKQLRTLKKDFFRETAEETVRLLAFRLDLFRQFGQPNSDSYSRLFGESNRDNNGRAPRSALRKALLKCLRDPLAKT